MSAKHCSREVPLCNHWAHPAVVEEGRRALVWANNADFCMWAAWKRLIFGADSCQVSWDGTGRYYQIRTMAIQLCGLCCAFLWCCAAHTDAARRPKGHTWPTFCGCMAAIQRGSRVRRESIGCDRFMGITGGCGANRRDESLWRVWANQCGCPILDRFGIFLALCDVIGDPRAGENVKRSSEAMQKGKAITHPAVQLSLNWESKISS